VDPAQRRIALTLKQPTAEAPVAAAAPGSESKKKKQRKLRGGLD
jgi:hypothetical protein